jgi:hypothetical protein
MPNAVKPGQDLLHALAEDEVAMLVLPARLPADVRASVLAEIDRDIAAARKVRPDLEAKTVAGSLVDQPDCELVYVIWVGEEPAVAGERGRPA